MVTTTTHSKPLPPIENSDDSMTPRHSQVKRIKRHRNLPKMVKSISSEHMTIRSARKKKEDNRGRHSKAGTVPRVAERSKHVVKEEE